MRWNSVCAMEGSKISGGGATPAESVPAPASVPVQMLAVGPAPALLPVQMAFDRAPALETVVSMTDDTLCGCVNTTWQLSESDKTITVRRHGIPRVGWVWGAFVALVGLGISLALYFLPLACSRYNSYSGYGVSYNSYSGSGVSYCDGAGWPALVLVVGIPLSLLLGAIVAILPRGCTKHVTVDTHDKADVKHLTLAHKESPFCCEKLNVARFHSGFKDRVLEFPYRVAQAEYIKDAHRRCTGEYAPIQPMNKTAFM